MAFRSVKSFLVATFSFFSITFSNQLLAQENLPKEENKTAQSATEKKEGFDTQEVIFGHILDNHEYHFTSYKDVEGKEHHVSIPLPIIIYSPQKGFSCFSSSHFENGEVIYNGYKLTEGKIEAVKEDGTLDESIKVYDFSLTRNVVQMILALTLLTWLGSTFSPQCQSDANNVGTPGADLLGLGLDNQLGGEGFFSAILRIFDLT